MVIKKITPTLLQRIVLALLLILTPFAMTFDPFEGVYSDSLVAIHLDPLYRVRASLIIIGLIGAVISVALLIWELIIKSYQIYKEALQMSTVRELVLQVSVAICSISIGWAAFPYLVNGVFRAYSGYSPAFPLSLLDPSYLMPMIWIGAIWWIGVLLLILGTVFVVPILFLLNLAMSIKDGAWKQGIVTAICLTITCAIFFLFPGYTKWFID